MKILTYILKYKSTPPLGITNAQPLKYEKCHYLEKEKE